MIKLIRPVILAVFVITALNLPEAFGGRGDEGLPLIALEGARLRGTAISGILKPIAIVEDTKTNKNYWYKIGDTLCGGRIVDIQRGYLVLEMNGKRRLFGFPKGAVGDWQGSPGRDGKGLSVGERVGENVWRVKLCDAIEMFTKMSSLMREARIRPYFAVGKAAGVRIDRIKDASVIKEMGLRDGDVIKGVNGFGLMTPTKIFEAYRRYKSNSLIQLQLLRNDEPVTLTYNIVK